MGIPFNLIEAVQGVHDAIEDRDQWSSDSTCRTIDGTPCDWHDDDCYRHSLLGAIYHGAMVYCNSYGINDLTLRADVETRLLLVIGRAMRYELDNRGCYHSQLVNAMIAFNNQSDHGQVLHLLRLAVRAAEMDTAFAEKVQQAERRSISVPIVS